MHYIINRERVKHNSCLLLVWTVESSLLHPATHINRLVCIQNNAFTYSTVLSHQAEFTNHTDSKSWHRAPFQDNSLIHREAKMRRSCGPQMNRLCVLHRSLQCLILNLIHGFELTLTAEPHFPLNWPCCFFYCVFFCHCTVLWSTVVI